MCACWFCKLYECHNYLEKKEIKKHPKNGCFENLKTARYADAQEMKLDHVMRRWDISIRILWESREKMQTIFQSQWISELAFLHARRYHTRVRVGGLLMENHVPRNPLKHYRVDDIPRQAYASLSQQRLKLPHKYENRFHRICSGASGCLEWVVA